MVKDIEGPSGQGDMERLNSRILEILRNTAHTHVALVNFPNLPTADRLQQYCQHYAEVTVITEKTAQSHYRCEKVVAGEQIPTDDGTVRHHATCEVVTTTTVTARYAGVILCSNRKFRSRISRRIGHELVWATVGDGIRNLEEMNAQEAAKRESEAQPA